MLDAFLDQVAASPFVDGEKDCALTIADWVMVATGCSDPAAHLRGRYSTALGRERLLKRLGGLTVVVADCARRARLEPTETPQRGDIGVIIVGPQRLTGICLGHRWAVKSSAGLAGLKADRVEAAWRVEHG